MKLDIQRIRASSNEAPISSEDTKKLTSYARLFIEATKLDNKQQNSPEHDALLERAMKIPELAELLKNDDE